MRCSVKLLLGLREGERGREGRKEGRKGRKERKGRTVAWIEEGGEGKNFLKNNFFDIFST